MDNTITIAELLFHYKSNMLRNYQWVIGGMILIIVVLFAAYSLTKKTASSSIVVKSYNKSDKAKPTVEASLNFKDLGQIKVSDQSTAEFTIKNVGLKPLQLFDISSSCNCTVGQIIYKGEASKEFGMHAVGNYDTSISPNTSATIRVIYRPYVMPVYGTVSREVYFSTNDPDNPKMVFKIKAFVK